MNCIVVLLHRARYESKWFITEYHIQKQYRLKVEKHLKIITKWLRNLF